MKPSQQMSLIFVAATLVTSASWAKSTGQYPEDAVQQIYDEALEQQKKTEEMERQTIEARDRYEAKKREAEQVIAQKKYQIEGYKMQQERNRAEMDSLEVDLKSTKDEQAKADKEFAEVMKTTSIVNADLEKARKEYEEQRAKLQDQMAQNRRARETAEKTAYQLRMEMQKMKAEATQLETELAATDAKKAQFEADEMKARSEWMLYKKDLAEKQNHRSSLLAQLDDAKHRHEAALKDLSAVKQDLAVAEKERQMTSSRVQAEVLKYEKEIADAQRAKTIAESDIIRADAEAEKLKTLASKMRVNYEHVQNERVESEGAVMKSRLALESLRTEVGGQIARDDKSKHESDKREARLRGMASAAEAASMLDGARLWVSKKPCKVFRQPASQSLEAGMFESMKRTIAVEAGGDWIKILNGTGGTVYLDKSCGKFENE